MRINLFKQKFSDQEDVKINYKNIDSQGEIRLYREQGAFPLKLSDTIRGNSGSLNLGKLSAGEYSVKYYIGNVASPISIKFEVEPSPFVLEPGDIKMAIFSDPHVMAHEIIKKEGSLSERELRSDRKLLRESEDILDAVLNDIKQQKPRLILIPGDLTKDGELISHKRIIEKLEPLRKSGIPILVIPGNHDINDPNAAIFDGDSKEQTPTVSPQEFASLYAHYGYESALVKDKNSLSYIAEPIKDLVIVGLDGNLYKENLFTSKGDSRNLNNSGGRLNDSTLKWLDLELGKLDKDKTIFVMIHHNVIEHFAHQAQYLPLYVLKNNDALIDILFKHHVKLLFTGHFHACDVAVLKSNEGKVLYEIETGSTITYPCPYRLLNYSPNRGLIAYQTRLVRDTPMRYSPSRTLPFQEQIYKSLTETMPQIIEWQVINMFDKIKQRMATDAEVAQFSQDDVSKIARIFKQNLGGLAVKLILTHYEGNEHLLYIPNIETDIEQAIQKSVKEYFPQNSDAYFGLIMQRLKNSKTYMQAMEALHSMLDNRPNKDARVLDDLNGIIRF
ncbi:metallophosphoesterase family protein [Porphyromonas pogonae]|nr:metallophosphoesterase [Porphyromonas pogonae]